MDNHFGLITLNWDDQNTNIRMETWDINNNQRIEHIIKLNDLQIKE